MNNRKIGNIGEDAVCEYLNQIGYEILARNYTIRGGEIDIIATLGNIIVFVEVKSRAKNAIITGFEAITKPKIMHILKAAEKYLNDTKCELQPRFDVASIELKNGTVISIDYLENAFDMSVL